MSTIKIVDTCTLINVFHLINVDFSPYLEDYYVVVTDQVISEYTRKAPRPIPTCLSVVGMNETDKALMDELEFLFPQLGIGERSIFACALGIAACGSRIVVLSDDHKATKKFSNLAKTKSIIARFPGSDTIIWGDTLSLFGKFVDDGKIEKKHLDSMRMALKRYQPMPPKSKVV